MSLQRLVARLKTSEVAGKWVKVKKPTVKTPDRIRTGIKNQSVQNPYTEDLVDGEMPEYVQAYAGPIEKYKFTSPTYQKAYGVIKGLLEEKGWKFYAIYVRIVPSDDEPRNITKFAAVVGDPANPDFLWYRYDTNSPSGSRNMVFCQGHAAQTSWFLKKGWELLKPTKVTPGKYRS
jgi:hypothetical protein